MAARATRGRTLAPVGYWPGAVSVCVRKPRFCAHGPGTATGAKALRWMCRVRAWAPPSRLLRCVAITPCVAYRVRVTRLGARCECGERRVASPPAPGGEPGERGGGERCPGRVSFILFSGSEIQIYFMFEDLGFRRGRPALTPTLHLAPLPLPIV